jgi:hypothetical protein
MAKARAILALTILMILAVTPAGGEAFNTTWTLVGYNNLGMHCMDSDYSVFSVLPPYNTIHAQMTDPSGALVRDPVRLGITVTYQAVLDAAGSINTTSRQKTNFWTYLSALFGATLPVDQGLAGNPMPGTANSPQSMTWDSAQSWWIATGIPITPYDDATRKNAYPMFHLIARDAAGVVLATTDIVLPVSDEMDCRSCHASGSGPAARPSVGWAWNADGEKDYRLNILLKHDDRFQASAAYQSAALTVGYKTAGLYPTAVTYGKPVLCAACHASEALGTGGQAGTPPLTSSVHAMHAAVSDPVSGEPLGSSTNRNACYRCHPGATTRCLRGAMGTAVAADGTMSMQCQSCHGTMSRVGDPARTGWLDEPSCQNCHTGTATHNNGSIRYTSAFDPVTGQWRVPVDPAFTTNTNVPAPGYDLYRFSHGHGSVACESCHGSTHAEFPTTQANDNVQSRNIQGHSGMLVECNTCHVIPPVTTNGGPHGMHPVGQVWVNDHPNAAEGNQAACQPCHGLDYRGTELSRSQDDRALSTEYGVKSFFRGSQVSCYGCHNGPSSETANPNHRPVASNGSVSTTANNPIATSLVATDVDLNPLTYRVVSQPAHGTVALNGSLATYRSEKDYVGSDAYTFAAWDGMIDSNLATVGVTIGPSACSLTCTASAPAGALVQTAASFQASSNSPGCSGTVAYDWDFGDGQPHASSQTAGHSYFTSDTFLWTMTASVGSASCVVSNAIRITPVTPAPVPSYLSNVRVATSDHGQSMTVSWDAANCPAANYEILYGYGSGLAAWSVAGGRCGIGTTGTYLWAGVPDPSADPRRMVWWLVVGTNGLNTEGSWGRTSAGLERGGATSSGQCGVTTKNVSESCAAP